MPIIGWMWYFLEIVFCKRKWDEDRKTVMQKLLNLRDYPENFWVSDDYQVECEVMRSIPCDPFGQLSGPLNTGAGEVQMQRFMEV